MNERFLPGFAVLAGLAISACACGSPASSGNATSAATAGPASQKLPAPTAQAAPAKQAAPAGYQIVGAPQQGISVAVPDSWKAVEFPQETVSQAIARLDLPASSQQIYRDNVMTTAARVHALYALDTPHLMRIYDKTVFGGEWAGKVFAASVNAFCLPAPDVAQGAQGAAGIKKIRSQEIYDLRSQPATVDGTRDVTLGGIPSLEVLYHTFPPGPPLPELHAAQIVTLPQPGRACYTTVTFPGTLSSSVLNEVIASARFYH